MFILCIHKKSNDLVFISIITINSEAQIYTLVIRRNIKKVQKVSTDIPTAQKNHDSRKIECF